MIDFATVIRDFRGNAIRVDGEPMTLGRCCLDALQAIYANEDLPGADKVKRFKLGIRIAAAEAPLSLTADEVVMLKLVVGRYWNALVVGRCFEVLDPASLAAG